jgi:L-amino acid N-acyltransferase YncA
MGDIAMPGTMTLTTFKDVDLADKFFDSLKAGYKEFGDWFKKKAAEPVYISKDELGELHGFLYLKLEDEEITDVVPNLPKARWLKVGTLKIEAHGTKLGERFVKKIFDTAIKLKADGIYVTVFEKHAGLIRLFRRYGFQDHSTKTTANGVEMVLVRDLAKLSGDMRRDYPFVHTKGKRKYLLSIYPEYHTNLLPDSILHNESQDIVQDLSHTNTIHKVYICSMNVGGLKPGDVLVMYRTTDRPGQAKYRSVVTSLCVVEEVKTKKDFTSISDFVNYAKPHSVFTKDELREMYLTKARLNVIRMSYNAAFARRAIRKALIEEAGLSANRHYDFFELRENEFEKILALGEVNESLIVD